MYPLIAPGQATQQTENVGNHQLGDRARIGIRRVEHRDAQCLGTIQGHLIGADAEAADRLQMRRGLQYGIAQLRTRADADHVGALQGVCQRIAFERARQQFDAGKSRLFQGGNRILVDAFQQQEAGILVWHGLYPFFNEVRGGL